MALDIQDFKDAGFNDVQAKLLANKLPREREEDIISKKDLIISEQTLRAELHADKYEIKTDIAVIKQTMATKTDIAELKAAISDSKTDILKWMVPLFITTIISIGVMIIPLWLNK